MAIYNPESLSAEEFINHDEILETLQYAKANKNNIELIDSILEKARPKHYADGRTMHCPGLTHREASVLLACDIPEKIEEIYKLARKRSDASQRKISRESNPRTREISDFNGGASWILTLL